MDAIMAERAAIIGGKQVYAGPLSDRDGTLHGILVEDARSKTSRAIILAENGRLLSGAGAPRVLLLDGSREEIDKNTGRLNVLTFAENTIDLASTNKNGEQRYRDYTEMSLPELCNPDSALAARDIGKLLVEANRRLTAPLTAASFAMVALVSVLTGAFRRYGNVARPLIAVLLVVALLAIGLAVQNLAARSPALIPLIWVHAILPAALCAWFLYAPQPLPKRMMERFA